MPLTPGLTKFTTTSPIVASYNYFDAEDGTGVVVYYGFTHKEVSTLSYGLSKQSVYSSQIVTTDTRSGSTPDWSKELDNDFDVKFNEAKTLKGKVKITCSLGGYQGAGTGTGEMYIIAKIRKWDGSTETELFNGTSETVQTVKGATLYNSKTINWEVDVTTPTLIPAGETLRLTFEVWARTTGDAAIGFGYGHDPKDRNDPTQTPATAQVIQDADTTIMEVHIPFLLFS